MQNKKNALNKNFVCKNQLIRGLILLLAFFVFVPFNVALAMSNSSTYKESGAQLLPASDNANSTSFKASSILTSIISGKSTSASYSASTGSPVILYSALPSSSSTSIPVTSSSSGGGSVAIVAINGGGSSSNGGLGSGNNGGAGNASGTQSNSSTSASASAPKSFATNSDSNQTQGGKLDDLEDFTVSNVMVLDVSDTQATIAFDTSVPSLSSVFYGVTGNELSMSSPIGEELNFSHVVYLNSLAPQTRYSFKIFAQDEKRNTKTFNNDTYTFQTLVTDTTAGEEITPVTEFNALQKLETVKLAWLNPTLMSPDDSIVIVRKYGVFPAGPTDGEVIFKGVEQEYYDKIERDLGRPMYAAYVKTLDGNYSRPAYAAAQAGDFKDRLKSLGQRMQDFLNRLGEFISSSPKIYLPLLILLLILIIGIKRFLKNKRTEHYNRNKN